MTTRTVGEAMIDILEANGVEVVFGIPGVHTVELYRGLASSRIRHITPRHEQGAAFMADGYARVSGKPGVCLLITGPGLTNAITAMAQAQQDSVPMLVISGVNARATLGHGRGRLHELPDQRAMMASFALMTHTLVNPADLPEVIDRAFRVMLSSRPGPVHIEIPTDVMALPMPDFVAEATRIGKTRPSSEDVEALAELCRKAHEPVILVGGGAVSAASQVTALAEWLDAPVVQTVNARGMMAGHRLSVPASASLPSVRKTIASADLVLAIGTQLGQTDYDMYADNGFPALANLVRIDVDPLQLTRGARAQLAIAADARSTLTDLLTVLGTSVSARSRKTGAARASQTLAAALGDLNAKMQHETGILAEIHRAFPQAIIVGDSTQLVYTGNLWHEAGAAHGWFNAATGFGALGYGPPAAIGAALAAPQRPVICLTGDGGLQFTLAELGSAVDAGTPVVFLVWNNDGYQEIETYMVDNGITPEGVKPSAPDFLKIAEAYGLPGERLEDIDALVPAVERALASQKPSLIEIHETRTKGARPA